MIPGVDYYPEKTNVNTVSKASKILVELKLIKNRGYCLDWGGGKYNTNTEYLLKHNIISFVYDPYARNKEHNKTVLKNIKKYNIDVVLLSNVLNVTPNKTERIDTIKKAFSYLKRGGYLIITVYKSKKRGLTKKKTWQEGRKLDDYLNEIYLAIGNNIILKKIKNSFIIQK